MRRLMAVLFAVHAAWAAAQSNDDVRAQARANKEPLLATLKELVSLESGSRDSEGLARLAELIRSRCKAVGAEVELVAPPEVYKMEDPPSAITRMARSRYTGVCRKNVRL